MKNSSTELLAAVDKSSVSFCRDTKMVIWYYKHALITFFRDEFFVFVDKFNSVDFWENTFQTDDGSDAILVDTCHLDIRLVILHEEFFGLQKMFKKSATQLEKIV